MSGRGRRRRYDVRSIAMEYVQLGDLEKNVSGNPGRIPASEARDIAEQILSGLAIMHVESFAHRNLKPQVIHSLVTS